jgi:hypothetical protein
MKLVSILIFSLILSINCKNTITEAPPTDRPSSLDDVEHILDQSALKDSKDGQMKIEIIGDTSHLFADEDFEKREVILLNNNDTTVNNNTESESNENANKFENCARANLTTYRDFNTVQLVNGSHLTKILTDAPQDECFLVLFYVPWCRFSARIASTFNSLPRAFPNLDVLAFDVSKSVG